MDHQLLYVLAQKYGLHVHTCDTLHDTNRTKVFGIQSDKGKHVLKTMYITEARQRFITEAEDFLRNKGIPIPRTIPTWENKPYFLLGGYPYVLQEWIEGIPNDQECFVESAALLGKMHAASLGFQPSVGGVESATAKWMKKYRHKLLTMKTWKSMHEHTRSPVKLEILSSLDFFLYAGEQIQQLLQQHPIYLSWLKKPLSEQYLIHGDFHNHNVLRTASGLSIIDWEFVKFDYPSRDFMKVLNRMMSKENRWDAAGFSSLLTAYLAQNSLTEKELFLFYVDLAFPHRVERMLRKKWYRDMFVEEAVSFVQREREKTEALLKIAKVWT